MPKLRAKTSNLKKVTTRIDSLIIEQINSAMAKLGMQSRAEFIRIALVDKTNHILKQTPTKEAS